MFSRPRRLGLSDRPKSIFKTLFFSCVFRVKKCPNYSAPLQGAYHILGNLGTTRLGALEIGFLYRTFGLVLRSKGFIALKGINKTEGLTYNSPGYSAPGHVEPG